MQHSSSVAGPVVSISEVKSILKKPPPSDQPATDAETSSTWALRQNKVTVASQVQQSRADEQQQAGTSAPLPAVSVSPATTAKRPCLVREAAPPGPEDPSSRVTGPAGRHQSQRSLSPSLAAERAKSTQPLLSNSKRSVLLAEKDPDPLSTFMMLRSRQSSSSDPVLPQPRPGAAGTARIRLTNPNPPWSQGLVLNQLVSHLAPLK